MTYWEFFKWPKEEQELALGEIIKHNYKEYLVVHLDEYTTSYFNTSYSLLSVSKLKGSDKYPEDLNVHLPSTDDHALSAYFKSTIDLNLSILTEKIYTWANRSNYKYINIHALEDYCGCLGASHIDWS